MTPAIAFAEPDRFVTLDRQDGGSFAGADAAMLVPPSDEPKPLSVGVRLALHQEYAFTSSWGEYSAMSFSYGAGIVQGGDLELGGQLAHRAGAHTIVAHAGIAIPIESDPDLIKYETGIVRLTDAGTWIDTDVAGRAGVSEIARVGRWFARVDVGVDAGSERAVAHANAGIGAVVRSSALMLESTNVAIIDSLGMYGKYFVDTAALSARFSLGNLQPYAALGFGIDGDGRAQMRAALTIGLDAPLR